MLSIVLAGLVFSPFAGQSGIATYASLHGVVTTGWPNYKPVANAQVEVSGPVDIRETRTDAKGNYTFLTLLPGTYRVSVPAIAGLVMPNRLQGGVMIAQSRNGSQMYVGGGRARLARCYEDANAPVELSAGLAYFANFDLVTHCT